MRLLFVHADRVAFEVGERDDADGDAPERGQMDDCVVAFVTVEASDRTNPAAAVANAADAILDAADRLNARKVVLRPSAHLSADPADRDAAERALRFLEAELDGELDVLRAPFGWYETFDVASKGHPFAEFSRRVGTERPDERAASEWRLVFPDGRVRDPGDPDGVDDTTRALVAAEIEDETPNAGDAAELLRELGLADGDPSERRWYPRGALVRDALRAYAADLAIENGAAVVETPASDDPLEMLAAAGEREHPSRLYETSDGSFGALVAATRDADATREEVRAQVRLALEACEVLGIDARPVVRATQAFYDRNEAWVASLVADLDAPTLLELLPERRGDRPLAVELSAVAGSGRPIKASSVELEAETDGSPVVRWSLAERAVDALVAAAAERTPPRLPTWLSPTQVLFVPVEESHAERCESLAAALESAGVRAAVDDRAATVGERIARAEADWVPYYAVVGDRERDGNDGTLAVNVRASGEERELTVEELRDAVLAEVNDLPRRRRYRPRRVSRRPQFADR